MTKPSFVYVTYIATTPEKLFAALTDAEMTRDYWYRHRNVSDWKVGSSWRHESYDDPKDVHIVGKVLERVPPRKLVVSWAFRDDEGQPEKTSRVTFEIEPAPNAVKLTVIHEDLEPGSKMLEGITSGWPMVLSSLKSLLETGKALPMSMKACGPE